MKARIEVEVEFKDEWASGYDVPMVVAEELTLMMIQAIKKLKVSEMFAEARKRRDPPGFIVAFVTDAKTLSLEE